MPNIHDGAANPDPEHGPASGLRFAVVVSRFNDFVTSKLLDGCIDHLEENGADTDEIDIYWVPGAFEIPIAAQKLRADRPLRRRHLPGRGHPR